MVEMYLVLTSNPLTLYISSRLGDFSETNM